MIWYCSDNACMGLRVRIPKQCPIDRNEEGKCTLTLHLLASPSPLMQPVLIFCADREGGVQRVLANGGSAARRLYHRTLRRCIERSNLRRCARDRTSLTELKFAWEIKDVLLAQMLLYNKPFNKVCQIANRCSALQSVFACFLH
jgi:hypothetical protein